MYIINPKATTKKKKLKQNKTDMLRKKRKWNYLKYSIKTPNGRKRVEDKNSNKGEGNK